MRHLRYRHAAMASPSSRRTQKVVAVMAGTGLLLTGLALVSSAAEAGPGASDAARGLVYEGLTRATTGPCAGDFIVGKVGKVVVCSHGPDPAPRGVNVTKPRSAADLAASTSTSPTASGSVQCVGDGTSGPRVQAVYAVASGSTDRFASIAPLIAGWAGQMDGVVEQSAAATGGDRHLRFVTNADCSLNVLRVTLSATGNDTFSNTMNELRAMGLTRTDRKYLVWAEALVYCGIAQVTGSDSSASTNAANSGPNYARVDSGCWGRSDHLSEVHELMHTLGAVQVSAPHGTAGYHCTDESDVMCYGDAAGVVTTQVCPLTTEWLLDCNHDDYFNTAPDPGSYLDTHWNVANSVFLTGGASSSGGGTASPPAATLMSSTFTGTLSSKKPVRSFALTVGTGDAVSALSFGSASRSKTIPTVILQVKNAAGATVASGSGPSVLKQTAALSAGSYTWVASSTSSISFSLTITYATP